MPERSEKAVRADEITTGQSVDCTRHRIARGSHSGFNIPGILFLKSLIGDSLFASCEWRRALQSMIDVLILILGLSLGLSNQASTQGHEQT